MLYVFGGPADLDPCANASSIIPATVKYTLPKNDGLTDTWCVNGVRGNKVYVNPPFGQAYMKPDRSSVIGAKQYQQLKEDNPAEAALYTIHTSIANWIRNADTAHRMFGAEVLMIVPAATDTAVWHTHVFGVAARCSIRGRVRFLKTDGTPAGPCPMACAMLYWGDSEGELRFGDAFGKHGYVER